MKILAIDPGINECAYAIIDGRGELLDAALIPNTYKTKGPVEKLKKAQMMCLALRNKLVILPEVDLVIIESSTGSSGLKNFNTMCRMAMVSGCAYGACDGRYIEFVHPPTWKLTRDKMENHVLYFNDVPETEIEKLDKYLAGTLKSKQHNILDAYCIALWAYKKQKE